MLFVMLFNIFLKHEFEREKMKLGISYYSIIKLQHKATEKVLSSISINYQTGSTQQVVRGSPKEKISLAENFWSIYPIMNETILQGKRLKCGDKLRLRHVNTRKWLHSHSIKSQHEKGYEVSGFEGPSDEGDVWILDCDSDIMHLGTPIRLIHNTTKYYLTVNPTGEYIDELYGQNEVYGSESSKDTEWFVRYGVFVDRDI